MVGTLCFECANAVPNPQKHRGCCWSEKFQPVPGWTAAETEIRANEIKSYMVFDCPEFVRDAKPGALKRLNED